MDRCHALEGVENNMKTMILASLLLSGCAINVPPEYNSPAVDVVCAAKDGETVAVSYRDQTKQVTVDIVPSWEELYSLCGNTGGACVNVDTYELHMIDDRRCEQHASHELGHVFEVPGVDVVRQIEERRKGFYRG